MTHSRLTRFVTGWISVFEWISWMNDSMTHSRLTRLVTGWISVFEWISWMNDSMTHSRLTRFVTGWISVFEWMIQWLTQDWLVSLLDESVFLNEWFNDSLQIDLIRYWMNQCFWMNDSMTHSRLTHFVTEWISVFEWISWMNDSLTHSRLTRLVTEWISVLNEWLTQDWLDSLLDESVFWTNDSMTHSRLTHFVTEWISVLNDWLVSLLNESVFWTNDSLKIDLFRYWMNQCFWMNDSMTHSRLTRFVTGWISVFEWMIQWLTQDWLVSLLDESVFLNDSKTNTYLTAHFLHLKIKDAHTGIDEWNLNVILQQVSDSGIDLWSPTLHITHSQRRRGGTDGSFSLWLSLSYLTGASHVNA